MHTTSNHHRCRHRRILRHQMRPDRRHQSGSGSSNPCHAHVARDLRRALRHREFVLHYQPEVEIATGRPVAAEALIRWQHPRLGTIGPDAFIPVAEEMGLIGEIGRWVIEVACAQLRTWRLAGHSLRVAVNVSVGQLCDPGFAAFVSRTLGTHSLQSDDLVLEVTESVCLDHHGAAWENLRRLAGMGLRLAIDDFGTGYSSLSYLNRMPVRILQIDRSFVIDLATVGNPDAVIVQSIISLAHDLDLEVIVEGVETVTQHALLQTMGCDVVQGFLLGRSLPPAAFHDRFLAPAARAADVAREAAQV